jgi:hypothetical protein
MQPSLDSKVSILKIWTEKKIIVSQHKGQSRQFSKVCLDLDWSPLWRPPGLVLVHLLFFIISWCLFLSLPQLSDPIKRLPLYHNSLVILYKSKKLNKNCFFIIQPLISLVYSRTTKRLGEVHRGWDHSRYRQFQKACLDNPENFDSPFHDLDFSELTRLNFQSMIETLHLDTKKKVSLNGRENLDSFKKLVSTFEISRSRLRNLNIVLTPPFRSKYLD